MLGQGADPFRMASAGALVGIPGFLAIILAAPVQAPAIFAIGVLLIGFGGGLFSHGNLTATGPARPGGPGAGRGDARRGDAVGGA